MLVHGRHPFPPDMEEMIRRIHSVEPRLLDELGPAPFDWESGRGLDSGRTLLRRLLQTIDG